MCIISPRRWRFLLLPASYVCVLLQDKEAAEAPAREAQAASELHKKVPTLPLSCFKCWSSSNDERAPVKCT